VTVAGRSGISTGRLRSDAESTALVDPGDRSAAGTDGFDVDHRHRDGPSGDGRVRRSARLAVVEEAHVGRRAAHVEADQAVQGALGGEFACDRAGADDAGGGAGKRRRDRPVPDSVDRGDAAGRPHDTRFRQATLRGFHDEP